MKIFDLIRKLFKFKRDRVLFLDLDGTLTITKSGSTFPVNCDDWVFKPDILKAISEYKPTAIHICSNQGGIESGFVKEDEFCKKMEAICDSVFKEIGVKPTYAYCKFMSEDCWFRKPNPGMIEQYVNDFYWGTDCEKEDCLMVGDASGKPNQFSDSDLKFAQNAKVDYCDVEDFISCLDPCRECKEAGFSCTCGDHPEMQPCNSSFHELLERYIKKP